MLVQILLLAPPLPLPSNWTVFTRRGPLTKGCKCLATSRHLSRCIRNLCGSSRCRDMNINIRISIGINMDANLYFRRKPFAGFPGTSIHIHPHLRKKWLASPSVSKHCSDCKALPLPGALQASESTTTPSPLLSTQPSPTKSNFTATITTTMFKPLI
mmetsp:Transcript_99977/g.172494  ORF Transcript_99977/g.172494 Transcript_99977/m.172494 type:complete len:157 (-) Transcript_99977:396-866(-)